MQTDSSRRAARTTLHHKRGILLYKGIVRKCLQSIFVSHCEVAISIAPQCIDCSTLKCMTVDRSTRRVASSSIVRVEGHEISFAEQNVHGTQKRGLFAREFFFSFSKVFFIYWSISRCFVYSQLFSLSKKKTESRNFKALLYATIEWRMTRVSAARVHPRAKFSFSLDSRDCSRFSCDFRRHDPDLLRSWMRITYKLNPRGCDRKNVDKGFSLRKKFLRYPIAHRTREKSCYSHVYLSLREFRFRSRCRATLQV